MLPKKNVLRLSYLCKGEANPTCIYFHMRINATNMGFLIYCGYFIPVMLRIESIVSLWSHVDDELYSSQFKTEFPVYTVQLLLSHSFLGAYSMSSKRRYLPDISRFTQHAKVMVPGNILAPALPAHMLARWCQGL